MNGEQNEHDSSKEIPLINKQTEKSNDDDGIKSKQKSKEDEEFKKLYEELKVLLSEIEKRKIIRSCLTPPQNTEQASNKISASDINKMELKRSLEKSMLELITEFNI